jgi:L-tartrate/succinate antiporter
MKHALRSSWRFVVPLLVWVVFFLIPHPAGLSAGAWHYLGLFASVIVALILEPVPASAAGLIGVTVATTLGSIEPRPADSIKWGLSGFSEPTVWLIFGALVFSSGYEKTGIGRRIALSLVRALGRNTLGLGYAVMLADLAIAPLTPSNTGRSAGVIYPIVRSIPPLYGSTPGPTARRLGAYLMWTAFAATAVTSTLFLTALGPNLLAVSLVRQATEIQVSWTDWLRGVLPVGLLLLLSLPMLVYWVYPPEIRFSREVPDWAASELRAMGRLTLKEGLMASMIVLAFLLWVFGGDWINPTTAILVIVALMLLTKILEWNDISGNRAAWDTLVYFATLVTLAEGLHRVGIVSWFAHEVVRKLTGFPPLVVLALLVAFFFLVHYLFASLTAHTTAVLPAVLAAGSAFPGMPVKVFVLLLMYSIGLMGVLTPYATGPAPLYFGSGYIPRRDFWVLGFGFGIFFLVILLGVGLPHLLWLNR